MNFTQSIEVCFKKFSVFDGRARKSEFWWFQLFCIIAQIVGGVLDHLFGYSETGAFEWVAYIIILLPSLAVGAYEDGDQIRMGNTIEFRSGADIMYKFRNNVRVGVGIFHISNAGLGYRNPGSEQIVLKYQIPF